jgi:predicted aldo/keto reductase-like oxidoreductase
VTTKIKRRTFLKTTSLGVIGGAVLPYKALARFTSVEKPSSSLVYRTLGKTGLKVTVVSYGVMDAENPALIHRALELGINHYDTAHGYQRGRNETMVGDVVESMGMRDKVIIATKVALDRDSSTMTYTRRATKESFLRMLDISLKRLKTDYVDILYNHSVYNESMVIYGEVLEALTKAKKDGKARFVGLSTHANEHNVIRSAIKTGQYEVILTAYNYLKSNKDELKKAIKEAAQAGIGIVDMKPMALDYDGYVGIRDEKYFESALKWVLADRNVACAIPGIINFDQLNQNFSVMANLNLDKKDVHQLAKVKLSSAGHYCSFCQECLSTCPKRVDIPDIMRSLMYYNSYHNPRLALETYAAIPSQHNLEACSNCGSCQAVCRNGNNIPKAIQWGQSHPMGSKPSNIQGSKHPMEASNGVGPS